jgi:hypothetical protein
MAIFKRLTTKARKDSLGYGFLNQLYGNGLIIDGLAAKEHADDGSHNSGQVFRAVATVTYSGGYTLAGESASILSVSSSGAGIVEITLDPDFFVLPMVVTLGLGAAQSNERGYCMTYKVIDTETIMVYLNHVVASVWTPADVTFFIGISCPAIDETASPLTEISPRIRGMAHDFATWNSFVERQAIQNERLLVGHTAAGAHNVREVARAWGYVEWDGVSAYSLVASEGIDSINHDDVGEVTVTLDAGLVTGDVQVFSSCGPQDSDELHQVGFPAFAMGTDYVKAHILKNTAGGNSWAVADASFWLSVHGEPA